MAPLLVLIATLLLQVVGKKYVILRTTAGGVTRNGDHWATKTTSYD